MFYGRIFISFFIPYALCLMPCFADDCLSHKISPAVNVTVPKWTKSIVQPSKPMDYLHGNVTATFVEKFALSVEANPIENGYCVVLTEVNASVGYTEFLVQIDVRHRPDSCGYNVTLSHENLHIEAHLSVISDGAGDIKRSVAAAAESVMPIFVLYGDDVDAALDKMERELQSHPDIVLSRQKIQAQQEIRNKKVDETDVAGQRIRAECGV